MSLSLVEWLTPTKSGNFSLRIGGSSSPMFTWDQRGFLRDPHACRRRHGKLRRPSPAVRRLREGSVNWNEEGKLWKRAFWQCERNLKRKSQKHTCLLYTS